MKNVFVCVYIYILYYMVPLKVDSIGGERMRNMNNNARSTSHELGFVMGVHIRWLPVTCSPFSTPSQFSWNTRRVANGRRVVTILPPDSYTNLTSVQKKEAEEEEKSQEWYIFAKKLTPLYFLSLQWMRFL